jgi:hypothetical protein
MTAAKKSGKCTEFLIQEMKRSDADETEPVAKVCPSIPFAKLASFTCIEYIKIWAKPAVL